MKGMNIVFALFLIVSLGLHAQDWTVTKVSMNQSAGFVYQESNGDYVVGSVGQVAVEHVEEINGDKDQLFVGYWTTDALWSDVENENAFVERGKVSNFPNPMSTNTNFVFEIDTYASIEFKMYDATGALVKNIDLGIYQAGEHSFNWDGKKDDQNLISSGSYYYELVVTPIGSGFDKNPYALRNVLVVTK